MSEPKRLFFALEIPAPIQQQVIQWRAAQFAPEAGRPIAAANLHLTLAFLGEISDQKQQTLMTLAGRIQQPAFTLTLDDAGHWPRSRVVWLGSRQPPRGLLQLANLLRAQAARSGCYQSPQPFHPHVTLLRNAAHQVAIPAPGFHWTFPVTEFVLYSSQFSQGRTQYQPLARWSLE
ncbi:RNA 2',3'-cyclic phosphodiesterase [Atlantibacter subterranea]|uniref:RNA 2',3'-cyclic phosphodiesterase n=1 Tax=Atlantibacter subterraneus TaxID=255519 RepID=A0A427V041_9ENTR|nr:RNA 2',3'-cyclic phosphodiesterase [Atlantibacter subterranea]MDA3131785.1 RNA 2',3'-cyclic phosphodiesterase [Atlantibacter subterranea]MDW2744316.1 RNA 2',3'-cyclic phosphodiesterase [Atlantibacter subterranea]RSB62164.1 RNA 2',3'-cyclic phosphodiesterase [Atlantibacter subterranea]RSE06907.1 RNA 2',3'-cyclic phosphodiesterase [Atlantibacter subterranea]RSE26156.1 RNA 2',3'-cyclic phosphodiesterase [Atlantibacter subterranea]